MEFLDRYLEAVRKHLPWHRQNDILAELRANLEAQLEEKEAALGRPLTAEEAKAWVASLDAPIKAAAGYQPQQWLIGPTLFPFYRYALRLACMWALGIYAIASAALFVSSAHPSADSMGQALLHYALGAPWILMQTAAWVTLVLAAVEYAIAHGIVPRDKCGPLADNWSIADLPPLERPGDWPDGKRPRPVAVAVIEFAFAVLSLAWLLLVPHHPWLLLGPGERLLAESPYELAPVWWSAYWSIIALNVIQLVWNFVVLVNGTWREPQPIKQLVFKSCALAPVVALLAQGQPYLLATAKMKPGSEAATNLPLINNQFPRVFWVLLAVFIVQVGFFAFKTLTAAARKRAAAQG